MTRTYPLKRRLRRTLAPGLVCMTLSGALVTTPAGPAHAQAQEDLERARSLFREGLSLEAAGNWAGALAKFQGVGRVKLTPQVRFHIARCQENLGRLNEALGEYRLAEYEASQQELPELASITEARTDLEGRVPKALIIRGAGTERARVRLDGVELGVRQIGQPLNVDPGLRHVVAQLPDGTEFEQTFTANEGETVEVELVAPTASPAVAPPPAGTPDAGPDPGASSSGGMPAYLPWVAGGVGVAGLAGAGVFYVLRNGAASKLDDACRGSVCPESVQGEQEKGERYALFSMVSLGVGVVGLGAATALFLMNGSSEASAIRPALPVEVDVIATGSTAGVNVSGRF
jgi:hypothetical protein